MNPLVIIGSHSQWAQETADLFRKHPRCVDFMAVGLDAMVGIDKSISVKYIVTFHPTDIPMMKPYRTGQEVVISHKSDPYVDLVRKWSGPSGSSSLLGVMAALDLGYRKIILCGCPLYGKNQRGRDYNKQYAEGWKYRYEMIKPFCRSMSGWTLELLGPPTKEWFEDNATECYAPTPIFPG